MNADRTVGFRTEEKPYGPRREKKRVRRKKTPDAVLLAALLSYAAGRRRMDNLPLAERILRRYRSYCGAADADPAELGAFARITRRTALLVGLPAGLRRYLTAVQLPETRTLRDAARFFARFYSVGEREDAAMLLLDGDYLPVSLTGIGPGALAGSAADLRSLLSAVIDSGAKYVILSHDHPSGDASVSAADRRSTGTIRELLLSIRVGLIDHIVTGKNGFVLSEHPDGADLPFSGLHVPSEPVPREAPGDGNGSKMK